MRGYGLKQVWIKTGSTVVCSVLSKRSHYANVRRPYLFYKAVTPLSKCPSHGQRVFCSCSLLISPSRSLIKFFDNRREPDQLFSELKKTSTVKTSTRQRINTEAEYIARHRVICETFQIKNLYFPTRLDCVTLY